jgi:NADPH:quinone reductase-like Zn-dependent oxidoreductase
MDSTTQNRHIAVDPENHHLSVATGPIPEPKADEVLIKVHSAGINRADLLQRKGLYPPPEDASQVMGLEVAGTIEAVGADAGNWQVGDKVCALTHGGGYADYAVAPVGQCLPIPTGFSKAEAAAFPARENERWRQGPDPRRRQRHRHPGNTDCKGDGW